MASPFSIFRKNSRIMMVVLTGLALFAFVILDQIRTNPELFPPLMGMLLGLGIFWYFGAQSGKPIPYSIAGLVVGLLLGVAIPRYIGAAPLVQTNAGNLTAKDMQELVRRRQIANQFIESAYSRAVMAPPEMPMLQRFWQQGLQPHLFGFGRQSMEEDVVMGYLLSHEADKMGVEVSDAAITEYINQATNKQLTGSDFQKIRNRMKLSEVEIYDALRGEIRAKIALRLKAPRYLTTPEEYFELYQRMNVSQKLELTAVPVKQFADKAGEPTSADLTAFFEQYKATYPNQLEPGAPGFRQPPKAQLEYLEADYETIESIVAEKNPVTDAEIEAKYAELKKAHEERIKPIPDSDGDGNTGSSNPLDPGFTPDPPAGGGPALTPPGGTQPKPDDTTTPEPEKKPESDPAEKPASPDTPTPDDPATPEKKPAAGKPESEPEPASKPEPKSEEKPAEKPADDPAADDSAQLPSLRTEDETFAVAFLQDEEQPPQKPESADDPASPETPKSETPKQETPAKKTPASETPKSESTPDQPTTPEPKESPADSKPEDSKPEDTKPEGDKPAAGETPDSEGTDTEDPAGTATSPTDFRPLDDDFRGQLRDDLLREKTLAELDRRIQAAYSFMEKLGTQYSGVAEAERTVTPKSISEQLRDYAKKHSLTYVRTPMLTFRKLQDSDDYPIGRATRPTGDSFPRQAPPSVAVEVFSRFPGQLYAARTSELAESSSRFSWWKVKTEDEHIPVSLDEEGLREEVIEAWKLSKAEPLAEKRAEELAELVRKANGNMTKALEDVTLDGSEDGLKLEIRETPMFSWLEMPLPDPSNPMAPRVPRFSDVVGVENPGPEFMETVFQELNEGETGVVSNFDRSIYYVATVKTRLPSQESGRMALKQSFLREDLFGQGGMFGGNTPYDYLVAERQQETMARFAQQLMEDEYNVRFHTPPGVTPAP